MKAYDTIYTLRGANNSVHLIDLENGEHFKISLYDLIPKDLNKFYSLKYKSLVLQYIKQNENKQIIPTIPYVLKLLIWKYFPSFC